MDDQKLYKNLSGLVESYTKQYETLSAAYLSYEDLRMFYDEETKNVLNLINGERIASQNINN